MRTSRRVVCLGLSLAIVCGIAPTAPAYAAKNSDYVARIDGAALRQRALDVVAREVHDALRERRIRYAGPRRDAGSVRVVLTDASDGLDGKAALEAAAAKRLALDFGGSRLDLPPVRLSWFGREARFDFPPTAGSDFEAEAMRLSLIVTRRRLAALGLHGARASLNVRDRILLQLPGALDPLQRLALAGAEATFHELRYDVPFEVTDIARLPPGTVRVRGPHDRPGYIVVSSRQLGTLTDLDRAVLRTDSNTGEPLVVLPPRARSRGLRHHPSSDPGAILVAVVGDRTLATGRFRSVEGGIALGHGLVEKELSELVRALDALSVLLPAPLAIGELRE